MSVQQNRKTLAEFKIINKNGSSTQDVSCRNESCVATSQKVALKNKIKQTKKKSCFFLLKNNQLCDVHKKHMPFTHWCLLPPLTWNWVQFQITLKGEFFKMGVWHPEVKISEKLRLCNDKGKTEHNIQLLRCHSPIQPPPPSCLKGLHFHLEIKEFILMSSTKKYTSNYCKRDDK